ncbi:MAG: adenosylcobinamide-GDP ribazoletransferase [Gammaproteobacteria bacterium]
MKGLIPLLVALQFLTRLPVRLSAPITDSDRGRSLLYYPLVGLMLGIMLAVIAGAFWGRGSMLGAAIVLVVWVLVTGGLHLDGLADSADAWVGGQGNRERSLAIMKDPYCGPAGVVALVVVLLLKFSALEALLARHDGLSPAIAPFIGRAALTGLFLTTPYVRVGGLGESLARYCPRGPAIVAVLGTAASVLLFGGTRGWCALAATGVTFAVLRALMLVRLGGASGDSAGATVEIIETAVLVSGAMYWIYSGDGI